MKSFTTLRRALLAGATFTVLALAGCGGGMDGVDHGGTPMASGSTATGQDFNTADVTFAQQMIPHHQQAVTMAELAETRAADPELKALAAQIKAAQAPEIATMTGWLTAWGQPTAAPGGHNMPGMESTPMLGMMTDEQMKSLEAATGPTFDLQFTRMMLAHHEGAVTMAKDEQANGSNQAAKDLAKKIETDQTAEIATLKSILARL
jgi:uncharacterized protein (DUF305 family)